MHGQPQNTPPLPALTPKERSRALERHRILRPCVEHEVPLTHVARHHGIPLRTVQRWLAQYRRDGFAGLARRQRSDRRQPHGLQPELKQIIEGLALLKPPPMVALVHRQVRDVALRNGWPVPNYSQVCISHDLRAPLRAINGFARILLEEHAPDLSEEAQEYCHLMRDNAQHMGQLIDDLLAFSRLSRQPLRKQPVVPAELVRQALHDLRAMQEERPIDFHIGALPPCQADPALLKQVLVNLLSNALKFTSPRQVAVIEVGCREAEGEPVYFVKDNGVGFNMAYADKLFGVFQRLHRAEEYEGTGVGLAIVQRIIHRHGGHLWAEAVVNQGATFFFTLGGETDHA